MAIWSSKEPCTHCGATQGKRLSCTACKIIGCQVCLGSSKRGVCPICKKISDRRPA